MLKLPTLKPGDSVDIIAPASRCTDSQLKSLINQLESWQLKCNVPENIFGNDPFCANTDEIRADQLINALTNTQSKAVICARGGYGSMRLIPILSQITPPNALKLFVGMSDITALHLYLQQQWQWPTIHGATAPDHFSAESIAALKSLLFGDTSQIKFNELTPLNALAQNNRTIRSTITGGNLSLIQASVGTSWQLNGRNKIILLEDTSERGYRIDRILQHLNQAAIFNNAAAILFGDFTEGNEANGVNLINEAIQRFVQHIDIPAVQLKGIGHDRTNFPIPLGTNTILQLGDKITLSCER